MKQKNKSFVSDFGRVRVLLGDDREPLFCCKDICDIIGYSKAANAARNVRMGVCVNKTIVSDKKTVRGKFWGGYMLFINLRGAAEIISKKRGFDGLYRWMKEEVYPHVLKHGLDDVPLKTYTHVEEKLPFGENEASKRGGFNSLLSEVRTIFDALQKELARLGREKEIWQKEKESLNRHLEEAEYLQYFLERLNRENKSFTATEVGQMFGMSAVHLNKVLEKLGIIRRVNGDVVLTSRYMGKNYVDYQPVRKTNSPNEVHQMKWTVKGMAFIYSKMKAAGYRVDSEKELFEEMQSK